MAYEFGFFSSCSNFFTLFRFAFSILRRFLPEEKVESAMGVAITADQNGAVFDVPVDDLETFVTGK